MKYQKQLAITRIAFGFITLSAVIAQLVTSIQKGRDIVNFFSFFTIESNILAAALLLTIGIAVLMQKDDKRIPYIRGAVTLFMTMTGIIYVLLLSGNEESLQTTIPAVNIILHYIMPVVVLLDWLVFPPSQRLSFRIGLAWLLFPVAYLLYSIVRGSITGWYPYPFLNPITNGWPNVIGTSLTLSLGVILLVWLLTLRTVRSPRVHV
jgi:hypothetical protein